MDIKRVTILFSGEGRNLENIIKNLNNKEIDGIKIVFTKLITNNPDANGIKRAKKLGFETIVIDHTKFERREDFDREIVKIVNRLDADLVVLAGFMRILSSEFTKNIPSINLHPSLLPKFKGLNAIKRSYDSKDEICGVSVHFVNDELDGGDIILQKSFKRQKDMSYEEFEGKIKELEYKILPQAIIKVLTEKTEHY